MAHDIPRRLSSNRLFSALRCDAFKFFSAFSHLNSPPPLPPPTCLFCSFQVKCLSLDRTRFSNLLGPIYSILQQNMRLRILKGVPLLSKLTDDELCRVAGAL